MKNAAADDDICVSRQEGPEIFEADKRRFHAFIGDGPCYQIRLGRNLTVGTESPIWESLLNRDLRGH